MPTKQVDTSKWLTRTQASDLLGVAVDTLRGWERRGILHPRQALVHAPRMREVTVYDPDELARIQYRKKQLTAIQADPGERTARAFELFEQGKTLREVVIELRETVARVEELHQQWLDLGGREAASGEPKDAA